MGNSKLCGLIFERGHGSMWGNQFYISIYGNEIIRGVYFPADRSGELATVEGICLTEDAVAQIYEAAENLIPFTKKAPRKKPWFLRFSRVTVLDGGEFKKLTVIQTVSGKEKRKEYVITPCQEAEKFEALLESAIR